jgi:type IV pilus assembly protein PilW
MPVRANMLTLRQAGLTLVELLVAMVLMLLVAIATVAMYNVSSSSYRTVDANQELQDSARFAMEIIGQAARSAGYQDRTGPPTTEKVYVDQVFGPTIRETWRVEGRNGQTLSGGNSLTYSTSGVVNSSDALVVRFFGANLPDPANPSVAKLSGGKPVPDGSMIDCSGRALPYPVGSADVGVSAFFVKVLNGEPELYCKSWNSNAATPAFSDTQVVRGVETLQIVYGVDTNTDEVADSWLAPPSRTTRLSAPTGTTSSPCGWAWYCAGLWAPAKGRAQQLPKTIFIRWARPSPAKTPPHPATRPRQHIDSHRRLTTACAAPLPPPSCFVAASNEQV